jgi:antitoxin component of MazEF toxin-antitoxin module
VGDSLAIRMPTELVNAVGLREGDEIEIRVVGDVTLR